MKILLRVLLLGLVLALLCGLVAMLGTLVAVPWLTGFIQSARAAYPWLDLALAIVLLFFMAACVLAVVLLLSVPSKRRVFVVHRAMGDIEISKQSIEGVADACLRDVAGVKRASAHVKGDPRPGRLKIRVQAQPRDGGVPLAALGDEIQTRLRQALSGSLAIEPKHIHVKLQPVHPAGQTGRSHGHARVPRVV